MENSRRLEVGDVLYLLRSDPLWGRTVEQAVVTHVKGNEAILTSKTVSFPCKREVYDGQRVGGISETRICFPTDRLREESFRGHLLRKVVDLCSIQNLRDCSTETLKVIANSLKPEKEERNP